MTSQSLELTTSLQDYQESLARQFAAHLLTLYPRKEIKRALECGPLSFARYQPDPVGFTEQVLNETLTNDIKSVMESVRDYEVTIARSANSIGKTFSAGRLAVWFYKVYPDAQVYTTAAPPYENLQRLLWGEIGSVVKQHPDLFKDDNIKTMHVARGPKSFITGVAIPTTGTAAEREAKFSGKHSGHLLFIVDEGDAVPDEVYRGIESCMSGGHVRLLIMFNPKVRSGPVWIKERDSLANVIELSAFDHPNVVEGKEVIPGGCVSREKVVGRLNRWSRPLAGDEQPDEECFRVPEYLVGTTALAPNGTQYLPLPSGWRKITDSALSYMVLGLYPAAGSNQLISLASVNAARSRWDAYVAQFGEVPPIGVEPLMGLDVADQGDDANVACLRHGGFVPRLSVWRGMDPHATGTKAKSLYDERGVTRAFVDGTGVGAGVAPHMSSLGANAYRVMVGSGATKRIEQGEFAQLRDQLWWAAREWLRTDPGAMLPPDELLMEDLLTPTYKVKKKIKVMEKDTMRSILKRSPDRGDAFCLTFAPEVGAAGGEVEVMSLADYLRQREK